MSFFSELKQRNVFKVAFAYAIVGWLLIQIAEVMAPQMNLPDWTARMVTFVVMLGFPISLVMAWALELTPEGVKKATGSNVPVYGFAVVLLALSFYWFLDTTPTTTIVTERPAPGFESNMLTETGPADATPSKPGETPSVAVLPFVNMSADEDNEYFSDGMTEELLNLLVRIEGLRVPSRTSSFAFKGQNTNIREIASQLEVNHILEGSVRKAGNQIRVTAQLIDVKTDTHLWSDTYDRQLEDVFAIQDEIAGQIVEALQLALAPGQSQDKVTENVTAYNLYLQGLYEFRLRGGALLDAEQYLREAVELDPEFAEAWGLLGLVYAMQSNYLDLTLEEIEPLATHAAKNASRLNPDLAEPHMVMANIASKKWDLVNARKHLEDATEKDPNHALAKLWYGIALMEGGYIQESQQVLKDAARLDPVSAVILDWKGRALLMLGEDKAAIESANRAAELGRWQVFGTYMNYYLDRNSYQEIRELLQIIPHESARRAFAGVINADENTSLREETISRVQEDLRVGNIGRFFEFITYLHFEDYQGFIDLLPEIISTDGTAYTALWWPRSHPVRQMPEFRKFAREYGLLALWNEFGWPDMCRPLEGDNFECD